MVRLQSRTVCCSISGGYNRHKDSHLSHISQLRVAYPCSRSTKAKYLWGNQVISVISQVTVCNLCVPVCSLCVTVFTMCVMNNFNCHLVKIWSYLGRVFQRICLDQVDLNQRSGWPLGMSRGYCFKR